MGIDDDPILTPPAAVAINPPLPAIARFPTGRGTWQDEPCIVLAALFRSRASMVLVLLDGGELNWVDQSTVMCKFPPDGPWRLLFGWAQKGPR